VSGPLDFADDGPSAPEPRRAPPRREETPPGGRRRDRTAWFLGAAALVLVVVVTVNSLSSEGVPSGGPPAGAQLTPIAVPLNTSGLEDADPNLFLTDPPGDDVAACDVRRRDALNVCALARRAPVVLALFPTQDRACWDVVRQLDRLRPRFPRVAFAAIGSRGSLEDLAGLRAGFPVGWDRDGSVAAALGLVACPQVTYADRGGRVRVTTVRRESDAQVARRLAALR